MNLCRSAEATAVIKKNNRYGYFALALYTICANRRWPGPH